MIALAWGTLRLNFMRWSVNNAPEEKKWGFGQFLAVILSTFPMWSIYTKLQGIFYSYSSSYIPLILHTRNRVPVNPNWPDPYQFNLNRLLSNISRTAGAA